MSSKYLRYLGSALVVLIFCAALNVLHKELSHLHQKDIIREVSAVGLKGISFAFLTTVLSYLFVSCVDYISFNPIVPGIKFIQILKSAFVGYAVSYNLGFSAITGSATRFRILVKHGLDGATLSLGLARLYTFFWLATSINFSLVLILDAKDLSKHFSYSSEFYRYTGLISIIGIFSMIVFSSYKHREITFAGITFSSPKLYEYFQALFFGCLDWTFATLTLYSLMPTEISFFHFLGIFIFAQLGGLLSHVPGGLGVFESLFLIGLGVSHRYHPSLVAALVVFRLIYYIIPLLFAGIILLIEEWENVKQKVTPFFSVTFKISSSIVPSLIAVLSMLSGIVLLTSGATPAFDNRMKFILQTLPLPVVEFSHLVGSIAGMSLIAISRGLFLKLKEAYYATAALLIIGAVASLTKGLDFEEASISLLVLFFLINSKDRFYRKGKLLSKTASPLMLFLGFSGLALTIWLTFFSYKHVEYANQLWWEFAIESHASRSLRALAGAGGSLFCLFLIYFFSVGRIKFTNPSEEDLKIAEQIVKSSSATNSWLSLLGDKNFLFSESKKSFIMYGIEASSLIVLGDPIGEKSEFEEMIWNIREFAEIEGLNVCFYEVKSENLPLYLDLGLTIFKLGEEAILDLDQFTLEGAKRRSFRNSINRFEKEGYVFEVIENVSHIIEQLESVSNDWLSSKKASEKKFSLGYFKKDYISKTPCAVIRHNESIVAFANLWPSIDKNEISLDLMRYNQDSPNSVMEYLFVKIFLWAKENNYHRFNLGMAPLSGLQNHPLAPFWHKVGSMIFKHAENYYNFQGLRNYKNKFSPSWEPRYLVSRGGFALPVVLTNITTLISGGVRGVFTR